MLPKRTLDLLDLRSQSEPKQILDQLHRIISSNTFRHATTAAKVLRFLVEEALLSNHVKEIEVGMTIFNMAYDPARDSHVRVVAKNLRTLLAKYYKTEGVEDLIQIVLPKGSYTPTIVKREPYTGVRRLLDMDYDLSDLKHNLALLDIQALTGLRAATEETLVGRLEMRLGDMHGFEPKANSVDTSDFGTDLPGPAVTDQHRRTVRHILDQLDKKDRDLLVAVYLEERDKNEICQQFGVDREYLQSLLNRTKLNFRLLGQHQ